MKTDKNMAGKTLLKLAEKQGHLSVDDIKKHMPDISKEDLEDYITLLRNMDIEVMMGSGKNK